MPDQPPAQKSHEDTLAVSQIKIGKRHRQDSGDLQDLRYSIEQVGQRDPIIVSEDYHLIAGYRRLLVCDHLERPVSVVVTNDFRVVRDQLAREGSLASTPMTPSEKVGMGRVLESLFAVGPKIRGSKREMVADVLGWSGYTYRCASLIVEGASEGIEEGQQALEYMDNGGTVGRAFRILNGQKVKTPEPKAEPFVIKTERNRQRAEKVKERLWKIVNGVSGYEDFLEDFDVRPALAAASDEEIRDMARMLATGSRALRVLRKNIIEQKGL